MVRLILELATGWLHRRYGHIMAARCEALGERLDVTFHPPDDRIVARRHL